MKIFKKIITMTLLLCLVVGTAQVVGATSGLDYSELEKQIGIANGLKSYDYTKERWKKLTTAVELGNKRLEGVYDQGKLDAAAEGIEKAIRELVKMDYSALIDVLDEVYAKMDENPTYHDVWYRMDKAVDKARPLLVSGDQQAVDEMVTTIKELMAELIACSEEMAKPDVVIQEVPVEVPPSTPFCNIPSHRTWPLLFAASVAVNVLLIAALGFVLRKKKNMVDNTPLVNYDIDDDMEI